MSDHQNKIQLKNVDPLLPFLIFNDINVVRIFNYYISALSLVVFELWVGRGRTLLGTTVKPLNTFTSPRDNLKSSPLCFWDLTSKQLKLPL